jgi:hypothetical protein
MPVEFLNKYGMIQLDLIRDEDVAALNPEQAQALSIIIDAVRSREAAELRRNDARKRVHLATNAEMAAMAANDVANPPASFLDIRKAAINAFNGVDEEPVKSKSHPKHAKVGPRLAFEKAMAETADARLELQAATAHHRRCELIEGDAMANWISVNKPPSQAEVHRAMLAKEQAAKLERVAKGLPPTAPTKPTHGSAAVDVAAAQRGRAGTRLPLRSNTTRR